MVSFDDQQLLLQVWRRKSSASKKRGISSTRSVPVRWTGRKVGEELKNKSRELAGKSRFTLFDHTIFFSTCLYCRSMLLTICLVFLENSIVVLKVNTKKHLDELVKERDSWKTNCIKIWKGVAPVLDLISPELLEDQPRAPKLTPVEKAQRAWGWL